MTTTADDGSRYFIMGQMDKAERAASDIMSFAGRIRSLTELERDGDVVSWLNLACERSIESERAIRECLEWMAKP